MKRTNRSLYYLAGYLLFAGVALLAALFAYSGDPLFLVLFGVVGLGVVVTGTSYLLDRRGAA